VRLSGSLEAEAIVAEAAPVVVTVVAAPCTCLSTSQWNGSNAVFGSTQDGFLAA